MAYRNAYKEIYFNNVPQHIDGGYCCIKLRMVAQAHSEIREPTTWNDYHIYAGRRAYGSILKWAKFLGMQPVVYMDGSVSRHTANLDWAHFEFLYGICQLELAQ